MARLASPAGRLLERKVTKRLEEGLSTTEPGLPASFTPFPGQTHNNNREKTMKIGLVVDSSCDLPRSFFDQEGVELMPSTIRIGDKTFEDVRDERETIMFHAAQQDRKEESFAESQS